MFLFPSGKKRGQQTTEERKSRLFFLNKPCFVLLNVVVFIFLLLWLFGSGSKKVNVVDIDTRVPGADSSGVGEERMGTPLQSTTTSKLLSKLVKKAAKTTNRNKSAKVSPLEATAAASQPPSTTTDEATVTTTTTTAAAPTITAAATTTAAAPTPSEPTESAIVATTATTPETATPETTTPEVQPQSADEPLPQQIYPPCPSDLHLEPELTQPFEQVLQSSPFNQVASRRQDFDEKILILTPVLNSENLQHYFRLLCSLSYPHHLISIVLGEDSSRESPNAAIDEFAKLSNGKHFRRVETHQLPGSFSGQEKQQDGIKWQLKQRSRLAKSRNQLLWKGLNDEDWVLWIDSDVRYVPSDLIQHLLSADEDVVAPSCLFMTSSGLSSIYDRSTWQETDESLQFLAAQDPEYLMIEGYDLTRRKYLPEFEQEGQIKVPLDGVGGCTLLVRANCHRTGLIFPPFVFEHHIETEGLAKLAKKMNFTIAGLPSVNVFHF